MKSNKQRKTEIKVARAKRSASRPPLLRGGKRSKEIAGTTATCNPENLAPHNSCGVADFVGRGYYKDVLFKCAQCQKEEVWSATRQKWWYEVAKGSVESRAKLCHICRKAEQARRNEARRVHLEGVRTKLAKNKPGKRLVSNNE